MLKIFKIYIPFIKKNKIKTNGFLKNQLTQFALKNSKNKNTYKKTNNYIPILILVFSVFFYFKNMLLLFHKVLGLLITDFINFIVDYAHLTFSSVLGIDIIRDFENIYYYSVTSDRSILYERLYKLIIKNKFNFDYNYVLKLFSYLENLSLDYLDIFGEVFIFFSLLLVFNLFIFIIYKIKKIVSIILVFFITLILPLLYFLVGIEIYFYDYNYHYLAYKLTESYLNRNVYTDSNYFLTSDSLRGIEKFTDLSVPWLIDYEDSGWGGDFDVQNQIDIWREKEHKLITEDIELSYSPYLEHSDSLESTASVRFKKIGQRVAYWFNSLKLYADVDSKIWTSWKLKKLYSNASNFKTAGNGLLSNIFEFSNTQAYNPSGFFLGSERKYLKQIKKYLYSNAREMSVNNDYFLPKKNNITNEAFNSPGNLSDRKQVVFRNVNNNLSSVENTNGVASRRPDSVLDTNYIFERQLQNFRIAEYSIKDKLYKYFECKWRLFNLSKYSSNKKNSAYGSNFNINTRYSGIGINSLINNIAYHEKNKNIKLPSYTNSDLRLESIVKYWNSDTLDNSRVFPRNYEYVYLRENQKFINSFNLHSNYVTEMLDYLVKNNNLGMGSFTYQSLDSIPWGLDSLEMFEALNKFVKSNISEKKSPYWKLYNNREFYADLVLWIDSYFSSYSDSLRKELLLTFTKRYMDTLVYFEANNLNYSFEYTYLLIFYEFLIKHFTDSSALNSIISNYIDLLTKFGISKVQAKSSWHNLQAVREKKIVKNDTILNYYRNYRNNFELPNEISVGDNILTWKVDKGGSVFGDFIIKDRFAIDKIPRYSVFFKNLRGMSPIVEMYLKKKNKKNIEIHDQRRVLLDFFMKNFLNSYEYYDFRNIPKYLSSYDIQYSNNSDGRTWWNYKITIDEMFLYDKDSLDSFNLMHYFYYGYRNLYIREMFYRGTRFGSKRQSRLEKYIYMSNFKLDGFPVPIFSNNLEKKFFIEGGNILDFSFYVKKYLDILNVLMFSMDEVYLFVYNYRLFTSESTISSLYSWVSNCWKHPYAYIIIFNNTIDIYFNAIKVSLKKQKTIWSLNVLAKDNPLIIYNYLLFYTNRIKEWNVGICKNFFIWLKYSFFNHFWFIYIKIITKLNTITAYGFFNFIDYYELSLYEFFFLILENILLKIKKI